jgi:hypothetical protein
MAALRIASLLSPYKTFSDPSASPSRECRYISLYCPKWPKHVETRGEGDFLSASAIAGVICHQWTVLIKGRRTSLSFYFLMIPLDRRGEAP